ncbi:MAG: hypothetical protein EOP04_05275 [Proteobacteria bacterium]|nr:MAG: hypothetical protein EOP04_05275 [Pseudomonadota bacterium]
MMFSNIEIEGWRQFKKIDICFHSRLTILTGANSAGKTTLLNLISRHLGWSTPFISSPKSRSSINGDNYSADTWDIEKLLNKLIDEDIDEEIGKKVINLAFDETFDKKKFSTLHIN